MYLDAGNTRFRIDLEETICRKNQIVSFIRLLNLCIKKQLTMEINFKIFAIENTFNHLFNLSQEELSEKGMLKMIVDEKPGYPCRVTLEDAEIGEEVLLIPFEYHQTDSPYKGIGPIFIRKDAEKVELDINEIPEMLFKRLQSIRVYDKNGMMIAAKTLNGEEIKKEIRMIFKNELASYIQIHNANPGCFNCHVTRV